MVRRAEPPGQARLPDGAAGGILESTVTAGSDPGGAAATDPAAVVSAPDGGRFTASVAPGDARVEMRRLSSSGEEIWTLDLPADDANAVALLHADDRVYAALYTNGATGSRVVALDAETGERLWERRAERATAAGHSKYSNVISLSSRPGVVVVSGRESAGEFREELDAATGRPISHEVRS